MKEKYPNIHSAEELYRELLEEYLTYLATEAAGVDNYRMALTRIRGVLETIQSRDEPDDSGESGRMGERI